jgi:uncharacterized repeat protein (TIGR01451 family)
VAVSFALFTAPDSAFAASADLSATVGDSPDPVAAGAILTYTVSVTNHGPDASVSGGFTDTLPAGTTFDSITPPPPGSTCQFPAQGGTGAVQCTRTTIASGTTSTFTFTVRVDPTLAAGTVISNTATTMAGSTPDDVPGNNSGATTTTVTTRADLSVTKVDSPDPVQAGTPLTYTIALTNNGPSTAANARLSAPLPTGTTFQSLSVPAGWTCITPAVGGIGTVSCTRSSMAPDSGAAFTLLVLVDP